MLIDTKYRSSAPEIMDDFQMEGEILKDALDKIAGINRLLGGNKVTLEGVLELLAKIPKTEGQTLRILDAGCGNGDMLRTLAKDRRLHRYKLDLIGIDANAFTIKHAQNLSAEYTQISYKCADIFQEIGNLKTDEERIDIILCTLTLHHFSDQEIFQLISAFKDRAAMGVVVNDLHRSKLAYYLFRSICWLFGLNDMSREDGLVSILRGFKKDDLERYSAQMNLKNRTIRWKWAFRYQWIIW